MQLQNPLVLNWTWNLMHTHTRIPIEIMICILVLLVSFGWCSLSFCSMLMSKSPGGCYLSQTLFFWWVVHVRSCEYQMYQDQKMFIEGWYKLWNHLGNHQVHGIPMVQVISCASHRNGKGLGPWDLVSLCRRSPHEGGGIFMKWYFLWRIKVIWC